MDIGPGELIILGIVLLLVFRGVEGPRARQEPGQGEVRVREGDARRRRRSAGGLGAGRGATAADRPRLLTDSRSEPFVQPRSNSRNVVPVSSAIELIGRRVAELEVVVRGRPRPRRRDGDAVAVDDGDPRADRDSRSANGRRRATGHSSSPARRRCRPRCAHPTRRRAAARPATAGRCPSQRPTSTRRARRPSAP